MHSSSMRLPGNSSLTLYKPMQKKMESIIHRVLQNSQIGPQEHCNFQALKKHGDEKQHEQLG